MVSSSDSIIADVCIDGRVLNFHQLPHDHGFGGEGGFTYHHHKLRFL